MTFSLSPGAGIYKTARDTPTKLIGIAGNVTFGSFTSTYNEGNRKLSAEKTEIFDPETMTSINAKGLPNEGLEDFLLDEWDTIWAQLHNSGTLARISVSPRTSGELASMSRFIVNGQWHEKID
ncbi:hypothetical protein CL653_01755, partial [bacterium]|nr:hypothetical protein [bacterium]